MVRALLPDAEAPFLLCENQPRVLYPLHWVHNGGLCETRVIGQPESLRYRLSATEHGRTWTFEDPMPLRSRSSATRTVTCSPRAITTGFRKIRRARPDGERRLRVNFAVWAPNARRVSVVGTFNEWDGRRHPMRLRPGSGIWELFVPGLGEGDLYSSRFCPAMVPCS